MVNIIENINPTSVTDNYDCILVGTNIYGKLTNGWQLDMKMKYPIIHKTNLDTKYGDKSKLGKVVCVKETNSPDVCLLYITEGYNFRPDKQKDYLSYDALEECLHKINIEYKGKKIICPLLGSSKFDGNGNKDRILSLFENILTNVDADVYLYEQKSAKEVLLDLIKKIMEAKKKKDKPTYYSLVKQRKEYSERLKKINNLTYFEKNEKNT